MNAAFQLGYETELGLGREKRERQQQLQDEERQNKVARLYDQGRVLSQNIASLKADDPKRQSMLDALANIESDIKQIYHPIKAPGAVQKDWEFLRGLITRKRPIPVNPNYSPTRTPDTTFTPQAETVKLEAVPGSPAESVTLPSTPITIPASSYDIRPAPQLMSKEQRQRMALMDESRKQAALDVAATGQTPEQQTDVDIENKLTRFDKYFPDSPKEVRDRYRMGLLESSAGIKAPVTGTKWVTKTGTVNGQKTAIMYDEKDPSAKMRYLDGSPVPDDLASRFVPDATKGQPGLKFDKVTGQVVNSQTGQRYSDGDPLNPPEVRAMFDGAKTAQQAVQDFQIKLAGLRGATYNASKPLASYDTWNGNAPVMVPFAAYSQNPGRYMPAGPADKAIAKENLMEDIAGTSQLTRQAINNLQEDFPADMKTKIALAMRADDPHAALDQLLASGALGSLTPDQQDFLIATRQLAENAMAMRSILSSGQGSEDMRNAIRETLPTLLSPDRAFALRQLNAFDQTIARLHRGVPRVPLNEQPFAPGGASGGASPASKGTRSITLFKATWQAANPGKPPMGDDEARQIITRLGYVPVP